MEYKVVIEPGREGGWVAYIPSLPGCVSQGKTSEEALDNLREALEGYLEVITEDGNAPPKDETIFTKLEEVY